MELERKRSTWWQKLRMWWIRQLFNLTPTYWSTGGRVRYISPDWREVRVSVGRHWRTINFAGAIFGGSLYSVIDPFYAIMLYQTLGKGYVVWDKAARIRYLRPAYTRLYAHFCLSDEQIVYIHTHLAQHQEGDFHFEVQLCDREGRVYAEIHKTVYAATAAHFAAKQQRRMAR